MLTTQSSHRQDQYLAIQAYRKLVLFYTLCEKSMVLDVLKNEIRLQADLFWPMELNPGQADINAPLPDILIKTNNDSKGNAKTEFAELHKKIGVLIGTLHSKLTIKTNIDSEAPIILFIDEMLHLLKESYQKVENTLKEILSPSTEITREIKRIQKNINYHENKMKTQKNLPYPNNDLYITVLSVQLETFISLQLLDNDIQAIHPNYQKQTERVRNLLQKAYTELVVEVKREQTDTFLKNKLNELQLVPTLIERPEQFATQSTLYSQQLDDAYRKTTEILSTYKKHKINEYATQLQYEIEGYNGQSDYKQAYQVLTFKPQGKQSTTQTTNTPNNGKAVVKQKKQCLGFGSSAT